MNDVKTAVLVAALSTATVVALYYRTTQLPPPAKKEEEEEDLSSKELLQEAWKLLNNGWHAPPSGLYFRNRRGQKLHSRVWIPENGDPLAVILFTHGYGGSVGVKNLREYLDRLRKKGFAVIAFEHPGHGHTPGSRARVDSIQDWVDNNEDFINFMCTAPSHRKLNPMKYTDEEYENVFGGDQTGMKLKSEDFAALRKPDVPIFLHGPSLGGLVNLYGSIRIQNMPNLSTTKPWNRYKGTIFYCPCFAADRPPDIVCSILKNFVIPILPKDGLMPGFLSRGATIPPSDLFASPVLQKLMTIDRWDGKDPKFQGWGRPMKWATSHAVVTALMEMPELLKQIKVPFLVCHDENDQICRVEGSYMLMEASPSKDKEMIKIPGGRHEMISNNPTYVEEVTVTWLKNHLDKPVSF